MNILIVEDDHAMADVLRRGLAAEGHVVHLAHNGPDGLEMAHRLHNEREITELPAVVLLDVMLPGLSGLEVCQCLRSARVGLPILMLSASGEMEDRIEGLQFGADDYMSKPFAFGELLARIRALARRVHARPQIKAGVLQVDNLTLDLKSMHVHRGEVPLYMTSREMALLEFFMRQPGHTFSRERILANVWGIHEDTLTNVVDVYICHLRKKIEVGQGRNLIHTVRSLGYRME
jgi:DNA-binding response OmpR family regulator